MKIAVSSLIALLGVSSSVAFAPQAFVGKQRNAAVFMADDKKPFFASAPEPTKESEPAEGDVSLEDEVTQLTQEVMKKSKRMSNLRNERGIDYAPWMNISAEDENEIRQLMKEKAEARRKRQEQERRVSGNLLVDSQAQELSGGGLEIKIIDGQVELEWATSQEGNTKGFLVKRRAVRTEDFEVIASYESWGSLLSQGPDGGVYRYLDTTTNYGEEYVYRVTECENDGKENDLCQALVEIKSADEERAALVAIGIFGTLAAATVVAGILVDPVGGF